MKYRRFYRNGGTYFFTVVINKRQKILTDDAVRLALRQQAVACIFTNRVRGCATHPTCGGTNFKTEV